MVYVINGTAEYAFTEVIEAFDEEEAMEIVQNRAEAKRLHLDTVISCGQDVVDTLNDEQRQEVWSMSEVYV